MPFYAEEAGVTEGQEGYVAEAVKVLKVPVRQLRGIVGSYQTDLGPVFRYPVDLVEAIQRELAIYVGDRSPFDDVTMVAVKRQQGEGRSVQNSREAVR